MEITRKDFDAMLGTDINLNPTARMVLNAYAVHMNYKDKPVTSYKSKADIATYCGINKDTAGKYVTALEEDGFLIDSGERTQTSKFHYLTKYYLGQGEVKSSILMRHKAKNPGNIKVATPTERPEPLRQNKVATPTEQGSRSERFGVNNHTNNHTNNQMNNQQPSAGAPGKDYLFSTLGIEASFLAPTLNQEPTPAVIPSTLVGPSFNVCKKVPLSNGKNNGDRHSDRTRMATHSGAWPGTKYLVGGSA